jgi:hypothetical protein
MGWAAYVAHTEEKGDIQDLKGRDHLGVDGRIISGRILMK